ncbi:MAG: hypothetical protein ACOC0P_01775 [Planctomycetota bacterium]
MATDRYATVGHQQGSRVGGLVRKHRSREEHHTRIAVLDASKQLRLIPEFTGNSRTAEQMKHAESDSRIAPEATRRARIVLADCRTLNPDDPGGVINRAGGLSAVPRPSIMEHARAGGLPTACLR